MAKKNSEIKKALSQFKSKAPEIQLAAAQSLAQLALTGHDFTKYEDEITQAINNTSARVSKILWRTLALWSLHKYSAIEKDRQVVLRSLTSGNKARAKRTEQALDRGARLWNKPGYMVRELTPVYAEAIKDEDRQIVEAALISLINSGACGHRIDIAIPNLAWQLGPQSKHGPIGLSARLLLTAAHHGTDITPALPGLLTMIENGTGYSVFDASKCVAYQCAFNGDLKPITFLLNHREVGVREGAAEGLNMAVVRRADIGFAIGALTKALDDEGGGVVFYALKAIRRASENDNDISPAVTRLERFLRVGYYSTDGWFEPYAELSSDLATDDPSEDAEIALRIHKMRLAERRAKHKKK